MSRWIVFLMLIVSSIFSVWLADVSVKSVAFQILGAAYALSFHWIMNRSQP